MNCSRFQTEYENTSEPRGENLTHLKSCVECRQFVNGEESLDRLFSALSPIVAPGDFGTTVQARISGSRSKMSPFWAAARIALPAAAMLLIVGYVVTNSSLFNSPESNDSAVAVVEETDTTPKQNSSKAEAIDITNKSSDSNSEEVAPDTSNELADTKAASPGKNDVTGTEKPLPVTRRRGSGIQSVDQAVEQADVMHPPGLDPDQVIESTGRKPDKPFTAIEILDALGVESSWKNGRLVVGSVSENSIGARSGLKAGDQIRSIDGRKVSNGTLSKGNAKGKVLEISRTGKEITINIGSN